jgi:hypothetical protein
MRNVLAVLCASVALAGCGSSSTDTSTPQAACNSFVSTTCNRLYACSSSLPGTAASCTTAAEAQLGCSTAACPSGKTFNSSAASQCLSDVNSESCTDINNAVTPASCSNTCQ